ncbi:DUF6268 family outer membrane beta-barrel protein [Joostella atrarenae]|uniref:DUF6268 family outer membrane beta-barrel protein n=1 Tax=Joostella atrarenae TaxID=679257 RepID=UPI001F1D4C00|nr:DUF6268 family outer membrane beta-barrel protein [Joostella atrarenae]
MRYLNNYLRISLILFVVFASSLEAKAQLTDLARIEYTYFPQASSENSFKRFKTLLNFPWKVGKDKYIVTGVEYSNVNMELKDGYPFVASDFERLQSFKFTLGYTFRFSERWRFGAVVNPQLASNFEDGIIGDDFLLNAAIYFIRERRNKAKDSREGRLILGIQYNTVSGIPLPLPYVNYHKEINDTWAYTLGVPKTNLKYKINNSNVLQAFVTLDGFYSNIQKEVAIENNIAESISMTTILSGIGYEHFFNEHILFYFYSGYTLMNNIRLRDADLDDVYTINDTNTLYIRGGIKFKI